MIARFDHRPMLTAALALTTIVLFVVVATLFTLLIAQQAAPSTSPHTQSLNGEHPSVIVMHKTMML